MLTPAIISPQEFQRRLTFPKHWIDVNFCRNPQCDLFAEPTGPFKKPGRPKGNTKPNYPRGKVTGSGDEKTFTCRAYGQSSIVKNNVAVVDEYRRLRKRVQQEGPRDCCPADACANRNKPLSQHPELYCKCEPHGKRCAAMEMQVLPDIILTRLSDKAPTSKQCEPGCALDDHEGLPISKISDFTGLCPRDVNHKTDFIYDRVIDRTANREGSFQSVNWGKVGRRFATDSQTLHLNWPNKKTRAQIAVQHLCTAHANTGYIMAAHLGIDPDIDLPDIESGMAAAGDFELPRALS